MVGFTFRPLYPIMCTCCSWIAVSSPLLIIETSSATCLSRFILSNRNILFTSRDTCRSSFRRNSYVKPHSLCQALLLMEVYLWRRNLCKNFLSVYPALYPLLPSQPLQRTVSAILESSCSQNTDTFCVQCRRIY